MRTKPLCIIFSVLLSVLLAFAFLASAGSLTPSAYPTSTMNTLEEIYNSVASTFDSSGLTANANGSVLGMLKYVNNNLFWASSTNGIYLSPTRNIAIGTTSISARLTIQGAGSGTSTNAFEVINNAGTTTLFRLNDAGGISVYSNDPTYAALNFTMPVLLGGSHGTFLAVNDAVSSQETGSGIGGDSFRMRYQYPFGGTSEYLIFEKTDGNHNLPDGGIAFSNVSQGGTTTYSMLINGYGNVAIGTTSQWNSLFDANGTRLLVQSDKNSTSTHAFSVLNGDGTALLTVTNAGKLLIGTTTQLDGSVNGQIYFPGYNRDFVIGDPTASSSYAALRLVGSANSGAGAYIQAGTGVTTTPANLYISRYSSAERNIDLFHVKSNLSVFSNLLSIGTTSSSSQLTIQSSGNSTSTNALTVLNSVGSLLFNINDAGGIGIGTTTYQSGVIDAYAHLNLYATTSGAVIRFFANEAGGHLYRIVSTGVGSSAGVGYFVIDKYASSTGAYTVPFLIDPNENVGIGNGVTMNARLSIKSSGNATTTNALSISNSDASSIFSVNDEGTLNINGTSRGMAIVSSNGIYSDLISQDNGTTSLAIFRAYNNTNRVASLGMFGSNSGYDVGGGYYGVHNNEAFLLADSTGTPIILATADSPIRFSPGATEYMRITATGRVGIGTTTPARTLHIVGGGAICSSIDASCPTTETAGDSYATTRSGGAIDVAEWIKASSSDIPQAGEIVVAAGNGTVTRSSQSYQKGIVGVVSTQPHLTMGSEYAGEDAVKLALTGRVPIKVSLENGQIFAGDTLTSSSEPGKAMKAKQEGPTVGIALQDYLSEGQGDSIMVLISLGYHTLDIESSGQAGQWLVGSDGKLTATSDVDFGGHSITNVKSILSSSGSWSIDESGKMVIQEILVKDKMRLIDKDTGEEFCSFVRGGAMVLEQCQ